MQKLTITCDDFAQNQSINAAVFRAAEKKRIQATSVMSLAPLWPASARELGQTKLDLGLHLDFTSDFAKAKGFGMDLGALTKRCYLGTWRTAELDAVIGEQLGRFSEALGRAPDYIDGHQHVQQFPQIRESLLRVLAEKNIQPRYMRSTQTQRWRGLKALVIASLGAKRFVKLCAAADIATNQDFAGVYDFAVNADLPALWRTWFDSLQNVDTIIMCHLATAVDAEDEGDAIRLARVREYEWIMGDEFAALHRAATAHQQVTQP